MKVSNYGKVICKIGIIKATDVFWEDLKTWADQEFLLQSLR